MLLIVSAEPLSRLRVPALRAAGGAVGADEPASANGTDCGSLQPAAFQGQALRRGPTSGLDPGACRRNGAAVGSGAAEGLVVDLNHTGFDKPESRGPRHHA